jgi:23S rRNA pseudouridine1911/1915/1917 synthase
MTDTQDTPEPLTILRHDAGSRLDRFVADRLSLSRNQVRRLLELGAVILNGKSVDKPGTLLSLEDQLIINTDKSEQLHTITPNDQIDIPILHEDANLLVINKPAGIGVHPLNPQQTDTVLNGLIARYPQIQGVGEGSLRSGVVHRLDVCTTGTLIVALTQQGYNIGRRAVTSKEYTLKRYRAIVQGNVFGDGQTLQRYLAVTAHQPAKVSVVTEDHPQSRLCKMSYRVINRLKDACDISIDLQTGFLHQIRVMMADKRHPIFGDELYGSICPASRVMLHAQRLQFGSVDVTAPIPDDMKHVLDTLRQS